MHFSLRGYSLTTAGTPSLNEVCETKGKTPSLVSLTEPAIFFLRCYARRDLPAFCAPFFRELQRLNSWARDDGREGIHGRFVRSQEPLHESPRWYSLATAPSTGVLAQYESLAPSSCLCPRTSSKRKLLRGGGGSPLKLT